MSQFATTEERPRRDYRPVLWTTIILAVTACATPTPGKGASESGSTSASCADLSGTYEAKGKFKVTRNGSVVENPANNGIANLIYPLSVAASKDTWDNIIDPALRRIGGTRKEGVAHLSRIVLAKKESSTYQVKLIDNEGVVVAEYLLPLLEKFSCQDGAYHRTKSDTSHMPDILPSSRYESGEGKLYLNSNGALVSELGSDALTTLFFVVPVKGERVRSVAEFKRIR